MSPLWSKVTLMQNKKMFVSSQKEESRAQLSDCKKLATNVELIIVQFHEWSSASILH